MRRSIKNSVLVTQWNKNNNKIMYKRQPKMKISNTSAFSKWLSKTLMDNDLKKVDLVRAGISNSTLRHWLLCTRYPRVHNIARLCTALSSLTNRTQRYYYVQAMIVTGQEWLLTNAEQQRHNERTDL